MLRAQQTMQHRVAEQRHHAAMLPHHTAAAAAAATRRVAVLRAAPPDGVCAAIDMRMDVSQAAECVPQLAQQPQQQQQQQQPSFLDSLPALPQPGTPEFEFSTENFLQRFEMSEILGEGTFGSVRRCVDTVTGNAYAVKVIPKRSTDGKDRAAFVAREVHMWRMLAALSPRVVGLQGAYQDRSNIYIVQELLLDDLQKLLDEQGVLPEYDAATAMRCVLEALAALHDANVVFGDVKPSNFARTKHYPCIMHQVDSSLPKGDIEVKMIDFGTAQLCKDGCSVAEGISGTPVFLAPEVTIQHRCSIGMDVWAAGAMLYLMLTGRYPLWDVPAKDFKLTSMKKAVATIQAGQVFWDIPQVQALSPACQDLLRGMLAADPAQRMTVHQALEHPWLREQLGSSGYTPLQKQQ